jgi:uncharacterized protein (TIGR02284 family)
MDNDKVISLLNDLVEICKDGQEGFRQAAEHVRDPELKQYFNEESLIRSRMTGDLQNEVIHLGGDPDKHGSVTGSLHRTWFKVKSAVGMDDQSIVSSVETGEDAAVEMFEKVLKVEGLPHNIRDLVDQMYVNVKATHDRIRDLRNSGRYKTKHA